MREFVGFFKKHLKDISNIFEMQNLLIACKLLILRKLEQVNTLTKTFIQDDEGFRVTNPNNPSEFPSFSISPIIVFFPDNSITFTP